MEREKPFIFIDTNFSPDEALMLEIAFNSFDYEIVGITTHSSLMSPKKAAENIVGLSADEEIFLSVAYGDELEKDFDDKDIFITKDDYVEEMSAIESLADKAGDCGKIDIIATGPLTNIAKALEEAPELEDYIAHIFILGGSLSGDVEEIFALDPEAINKVLNTGIDIFIIPVELYKSVVLTDEIKENLRDKGENLDRILDLFDDNEGYLKAPLLLYLTQTPEAFIFEESGFMVDTKEEAGSLHRVDSRKKNYMANKVNEEAFYDFILGSL